MIKGQSKESNYIGIPIIKITQFLSLKKHWLCW